MTEESLILAAKYIKDAEVLIFTSGAGLGVDSGISTFRGINAGVSPYSHLTLQELSVPLWFEDDKDPIMAYSFWQSRYIEYTNSKPHEGYYLLQNFAKNKPYFVHTSNIDGHWLESGISETNIVEIHGSARYQQCRDNCSKDFWPTTQYTFMPIEPLTICHNCNTSLVRPNVCMFEDYGFNDQRLSKQKVNWLSWPYKKSQKITVVEIGAGTQITTIRNLSTSIVRQHESNKLVRINLEEDNLNGVSEGQGVSVKMGALEALKNIDDLLSL